jgi:hypothetical protein
MSHFTASEKLIQALEYESTATGSSTAPSGLPAQSLTAEIVFSSPQTSVGAYTRWDDSLTFGRPTVR